MILSKFVGYNVLRSKTKPRLLSNKTSSRLLGENNFANQKKRSFSLCVPAFAGRQVKDFVANNFFAKQKNN
jgi:hypothetical protein